MRNHLSKILIGIGVIFSLSSFARVSQKFSHAEHKGHFEKLNVECTECHAFHFKSKNQDPLEGRVPKGHIKADHQTCTSCHGRTMTASFVNSCTVCHESQSLKGANHPIKKNCVECHKSSEFNHSSLLDESGQMCLECHADRKFKHRSVSGLAETQRGMRVLLEGQEVSCKTCHRAHQSSKSTKLLFDQKDVMVFCTSCHKNQIKYFHKKLSK